MLSVINVNSVHQEKLDFQPVMIAPAMLKELLTTTVMWQLDIFFCHEHVVGNDCDKCAEGYYGFPNCQACQCNLDGTIHDHDDEDDEHDHHGEVASCDANGQCACKDNYTGDKCDHCAPDHYNIANTCHPCGCNEDGSVDQNCNPHGKCTCKPN